MQFTDPAMPAFIRGLLPVRPRVTEVAAATERSDLVHGAHAPFQQWAVSSLRRGLDLGDMEAALES